MTDRDFTKHELDVQNFDAMREEEFYRAMDLVVAAITEALDELRERHESDDLTLYPFELPEFPSIRGE